MAGGQRSRKPAKDWRLAANFERRRVTTNLLGYEELFDRVNDVYTSAEPRLAELQPRSQTSEGLSVLLGEITLVKVRSEMRSQLSREMQRSLMHYYRMSNNLYKAVSAMVELIDFEPEATFIRTSYDQSAVEANFFIGHGQLHIFDPITGGDPNYVGKAIRHTPTNNSVVTSYIARSPDLKLPKLEPFQYEGELRLMGGNISGPGQ